MTFLKVLLIVLAVLWLISRIRVGARVRYGAEGLFLWVLAGPFKVKLLPAGEKKKKRKKKEKAAAEGNEPPAVADGHKKEPEEGRPGTLSRLMQLLPVAGQACGALKRKIRIDDLELELIWGGADPAAIALGYGQANAALGMIWPILDNNFKVKRHSFQVGMDYGRTRPGAELAAALTLTIGQALTLGVHYGVKALMIWIRSGKPARKKQEAMSHE